MVTATASPAVIMVTMPNPTQPAHAIASTQPPPTSAFAGGREAVAPTSVACSSAAPVMIPLSFILPHGVEVVPRNGGPSFAVPPIWRWINAHLQFDTDAIPEISEFSFRDSHFPNEWVEELDVSAINSANEYEMSRGC